MENWSKEEITELKKFWVSPVGKKYIKRMEDTKEQLLQLAMTSMSPDDCFKNASIANGFDSVLLDIDSVVNKKEEKEAAAQK